jgi:hypothetical protein
MAPREEAGGEEGEGNGESAQKRRDAMAQGRTHRLHLEAGRSCDPASLRHCAACQRLRELRHRPEPSAGRPRQRPAERTVHLLRHLRSRGTHARQRLAQPLGDHRHRGRARIGRRPRQHLVQHHGQRVDVGAGIHGHRPVRLLGAHVGRRAHGRAALGDVFVSVGGAGDPEIGHQRVAVPGEEQVFRLDVAMDHALFVGVLQCFGRVAGDPERLVHRQPALAPEPVAERLAVHVRHGEPEAAGDLARVVDRKDVGMLQPGGEADLPLESLGPERGGQLRQQDLERHRTVVLEVPNQVDHGHAAPPELALERIAVGESRLEQGRRVHERGPQEAMRKSRRAPYLPQDEPQGSADRLGRLGWYPWGCVSFDLMGAGAVLTADRAARSSG